MRPGLIARGSSAITSGYLVVLSSELREKILTSPLGSRCTCARSPSYLYSHVNRPESKRSSTSEMPLVGFASIGFTGTPGVRRAWSWSSSMPCSSRAGTITS